MTRPDAIVVLTTWPAASDPAEAAATLVDERLAACVSILPEMDSVYSWQGSIVRDRERQVVIKTTAARLEALQRRMIELHPYDVPEWLVLAAEGASDPYMSWLAQATDSVPASPQS